MQEETSRISQSEGEKMPIDMIVAAKHLSYYPWEYKQYEQILKKYQDNIRNNNMTHKQVVWAADQLDIALPTEEDTVFLFTEIVEEPNDPDDSDSLPYHRKIYTAIPRSEYVYDPASNYNETNPLNLDPQQRATLLTNLYNNLLAEGLQKHMSNKPQEILQRMWKKEHPESDMQMPIDSLPYIQPDADKEEMRQLARKINLEMEESEKRDKEKQLLLTRKKGEDFPEAYHQYQQTRESLRILRQQLLRAIQETTQKGLELPPTATPAYDKISDYLLKPAPNFFIDPATTLQEIREMTTTATIARYEIALLTENAHSPLDKIIGQIREIAGQLSTDREYFSREASAYAKIIFSDLSSQERREILVDAENTLQTAMKILERERKRRKV